MFRFDSALRFIDAREDDILAVYRSEAPLVLHLEGVPKRAVDAFLCIVRRGDASCLYAAFHAAGSRHTAVYVPDPSDETARPVPVRQALAFLEGLGFRLAEVNLKYGKAMRGVVIRDLRIFSRPDPPRAAKVTVAHDPFASDGGAAREAAVLAPVPQNGQHAAADKPSTTDATFHAVTAAMQGENRKLLEQAATLRQELSHARSRIAALDAEVAAFRSGASETTAREASVRAELASRDQVCQALERDKAVLERELEEARDHLEAFRRNAAERERHEKSLERELARQIHERSRDAAEAVERELALQREVERLREASDLRQEQHRKRLAKGGATAAALRAQVEQWKARLAAAEGECEALKAENAKLVADRAHLLEAEAERESLARELEAARALAADVERKRSEAERAAAGEFEALRAELAAGEKREAEAAREAAEALERLRTEAAAAGLRWKEAARETARELERLRSEVEASEAARAAAERRAAEGKLAALHAEQAFARIAAVVLETRNEALSTPLTGNPPEIRVPVPLDVPAPVPDPLPVTGAVAEALPEPPAVEEPPAPAPAPAVAVGTAPPEPSPPSSMADAMPAEKAPVRPQRVRLRRASRTQETPPPSPAPAFSLENAVTPEPEPALALSLSPPPSLPVAPEETAALSFVSLEAIGEEAAPPLHAEPDQVTWEELGANHIIAERDEVQANNSKQHEVLTFGEIGDGFAGEEAPPASGWIFEFCPNGRADHVRPEKSFTSLNMARLNHRGKAENCSGKAVAGRKGNGFLVEVVFSSGESGKEYVYRPASQPRTEQECAEALRCAVAFAEEVGFLMEETGAGGWPDSAGSAEPRAIASS